MALEVVDLLAPEGRIEPDLFPGEGSGAPGTALGERINTYLAEAARRVAALPGAPDDPDEAVRLWVYYRAFDAACVRLAALPGEISQDDAGSHRYAKDQRDTVCGKAQEARAAFEALVRLPPTPVAPAVSRTVANTYSW